MKKKNVWYVYLWLLVTFFCWGSIYVATKYLSGTMPAAFIACIRNVIAVPALCLMGRGKWKKVEKADRKYFLMVGILGYYLTFFINQQGVALAGASVSALLNTINPVTIALLAAVVLKEKIRPIQVVCLVLALAGAYVVLAGATGGTQLNGLLLVLASVVTWGIASVYMRLLTAKYPPVMVTALGMIISLPFHIPTATFYVLRDGMSLTAKTVVLLLYLGLVASALAQYLWTKSLSVLPAATCSLFYPLQPVFSAVLGVVVLGETFGLNFFVGLILIGGDILLNCFDGIRQQKAAAR